MLVTVDTGNQKSADVLSIEAERDRDLNGGVEWSGRMWHTDAVFQSQLTAYLAAFREGLIPANATVEVRSKDNTVNHLSRADLLQLAGTVMVYVQGVYKRSWARKDAL
jgi:hypothetical protein